MKLSYAHISKLNAMLNTMTVGNLDTEKADRIVQLKGTIEDAIYDFQMSINAKAEEAKLEFDDSGNVVAGDETSFLEFLKARQLQLTEVEGFLSNNEINSMYEKHSVPGVADRTFIRRVLLNPNNKA